MSNPNNASTVLHILSHLDANPGKILTKDAQNEYLQTLTSTYMCYYKSSTFGCTLHDETSLRKALTSIMASNIRPGVDVRPGKSAVDELFERGSEMLDEKYVEGLREAAKGQVFEKRMLEEDTCSDEDHREDWAVLDPVEDSSGSDEDYEPGSKRTRAARKGKTEPSRRIESAHSIPTPLGAPKKKRVPQPTWYGASTDRSESPLGHKGRASVTHHRPSTSCASEDSEGDDADDESCNKRVRVWRKSVHESHRAETMLRKLSTLLEQDKLHSAQAEYTSCGERKTSGLKFGSITTPDLSTRVAELNDLVRSSAERYVAGHPTTHVNLITRPPPELEALYAQVFSTSNWKSIAVHLQSTGALAAADLLRSLVSAFLFTRIFSKAEDLPWLAPEAIRVFKILEKRLLDQDTGLDVDGNVSYLFDDDQFRTTILRPQARMIASECRLVLNDHLRTLSGSRRSCEIGTKFREDLELAFEKALEIQTCLSLGTETHEWTWTENDFTMNVDGMSTAGIGDRSGRVALTLFPGLVWAGGKNGGSSPAIVACS